MLDTESRHSTGLDQGPSRDPWLTMDYYLDTDSISLQEMLDVDIKSEIENVIGEHNDMGFNFTDWSPLDLDEAPIDSQDDLNKWLNSTSLLNGNSNSSNSNFNLDLNGADASSVMVNPNSVIPLLSARARSPVLSLDHKRRFSFTTCSTTDVKDEKISVDDETEVEQENDTETEQYEHDEEASDSDEDEESDDEDEEDEENEATSKTLTMPMKPKQTILFQNGNIKNIAAVAAAAAAAANPQITKAQPMSKLNNAMPAGIRLQNVKVLSPSQAHQVRKQIYNNNVHVAPSATQITVKREKDYDLSDYDDKPYPKPAYSYSCLIAMALKNSQTGSLPVSEIYNFMCEHFPYFKTAPNGWKNSVRHNLSLNKCFEKIEKPAGNGNQRKGCLWAINPAKVAKMDEEVQKWSRKDPLAIKKAMIYPDQLELLERGEMKYAGNGDLSADDSESSGDEATEENATYDTALHVAAANSVTDSYDESSQDCDVDITEQTYDEIDIDENKDALRMQLGITKQDDDNDDEDDDEDDDQQGAGIAGGGGGGGGGSANLSTTHNVQQLSSSNYEYDLNSATKRQKTSLVGSIQANYVYQPVANSRRKAPLLLRAGANGSFLKID